MTNGSTAGDRKDVALGPQEVANGLSEILDRIQVLRGAVLKMDPKRKVIISAPKNIGANLPMVDYCLVRDPSGPESSPDPAAVELRAAQLADALERIGDWINDVRMVLGKMERGGV